MKRILITVLSVGVVVALLFGVLPAMAAKPPSVIPFSNGFPSGMHFNLNIHGKDPSTFTCPSGPPPYGNSIFIPEYTADYTPAELESVTMEIVSDKKASVTELTVLDPCAMPIGYGDDDGATIQLPYKIQEEGAPKPIVALGYFVYGRILGKPNNSKNGDPPESNIILTPRPVLQFDYTDLNGITWLLGLVTTDGVYEVENNEWKRFETQTPPKKGKSKAQNITDLFMWTGWVCDESLDLNGDGVIDDLDANIAGYSTVDEWLTALDDPSLARYYEDWWVFDVADIVCQTWDIDNDGTKLLQIRFYPVATTDFTEEGHIAVYKETIPDTDTTTLFDFDAEYRAPFQMTNNQFSLSLGLGPDTYLVEELTPPKGWALTNIDIDDPTGGSSDSGNTATIDLALGETVRVTFTNTQSQIVVVKEYLGTDPPSEKFDYTLGSTAFSLTGDGATYESEYLAPATYSVTEATPPTNWTFTEIVIEGDTDGGSPIPTPGSTTAEIDLDAGERIIVTFKNTYTAPSPP